MGSAHLNPTFEVIALSMMVLIIVVDLLLVFKRPHVPSFKECVAWVSLYVSLALIFGLVLYFVTQNGEVVTQFYTGWLVEYSMSVDNLFIFIVILTRFKVPPKDQQTVLMIGIIIALILRAGMILIGAAVIERFSPIFYVFGAFLIWTAWTQVKPGGGHGEDKGEGKLIGAIRTRLAIHEEYDDNKFRTVVDGKKVWTPMILVVVALGTTDLMFALDSIPAIFGITKDPFIVFSTNLFALMGLRQLYFLLGGLIDRLVYLPYGLAGILLFIGIKLILEAMHLNEISWLNNGEPFHVPHITPLQSLIVIASILIATTLLSLTVGKRRFDQEHAH